MTKDAGMTPSECVERAADKLRPILETAAQDPGLKKVIG